MYVNSERWLAKSRVDILDVITENFFLYISLCYIYYKTNIKLFFGIDIQLYQHSWKLANHIYIDVFFALYVSMYIQLFQFRLSPSKWKSRIRARKACWESLKNSWICQRFPAAFRTRIRLFRFAGGNLNWNNYAYV